MNSRVLPVLALFLAVGTFFVYVNPLWNGKVAELKRGIASDNQALAAAADYTKRQNELAAERDAIDPADLTRLETLLPDSVDNVGLILDLNALAARSGLSLSNIDVANSAQGTAAQDTASDPVGAVDLSVTAIGTYGGLKEFLDGVEHSARILDIEDLAVKGSQTGVYNYQMTIRLYWLR